MKSLGTIAASIITIIAIITIVISIIGTIDSTATITTMTTVYMHDTRKEQLCLQNRAYFAWASATLSRSTIIARITTIIASIPTVVTFIGAIADSITTIIDSRAQAILCSSLCIALLLT
jgi:hypothetical protein